MLTITVAVGLLPLVSTTVEATDVTYDYVVYDSYHECYYVSDSPFYLWGGFGTTGKTFNAVTYKFAWATPFDGVATVTAEQALNHTTGVAVLSTESENTYIVYLTSDGQWAISPVNLYAYSNTAFGMYYCINFYHAIQNTGTRQPKWTVLQSNHTINLRTKTVVGSDSGVTVSDNITLPEPIDVEELINESLNTQTEAGQIAQTIINNTTNQYNLYLSGDIDSATMQQNVTINIDTLSDLTPSTLLDAMQINNGLTYNQTIQDKLLNTASGNVQTMINGYQNTINNAITNYQNGTTSQQDTVKIINQAITNLNNMIINGIASTTADVNAVNAAINAANANLDSVTGYKDVSQEASDKSQASDQAELDYLDDLTAETTATVEEIAPSQNFTGSQTGEAQQVLEIVWENEFVKRLLPMCAGFMVVCVVLGIRYKV